MKILVTGFDPFGTDQINSSIEAVKLLPDQIDDTQVIKLQIPTIFDQVGAVVQQAIEKNQPDFVLNVGQSSNRYGLTPELVAINYDDARIADNAGFQPIDQTIHSDGQNAYFTQLPIKKMVQAIHNVGLPSYISTTSGTFVCNHIMYQVQYLIDKKFPNLKAGFIHIPYLPNQVIDRRKTPCLSLQDDVIGLTAAIKAIV
ncbi:pyroglutamyl-peptidase I [Companilactobacillus sp. FL22-1]|uniref:pyroglutamyl-peptidase I n=1 Tax=Companilactobacillus sp. FL22-1 TaxID=3373892 RepID=UPI00375452C8